MTDQAPAIPSERAMDLLRERIAADDGLVDALRAAVLEDLADEQPAGFARLKAALNEVGAGDETGETYGS